MPRRVWYPNKFAVAIIAYRLASDLFPKYESPMPPFVLLGREGEALLESALGQPQQTFGGRALYPTIYDKAAVLLRSLTKNHPFRDGNKRIAVATTFIFLMMNGYWFLPTNDEIVDFALSIARSKPTVEWQSISRWIRRHTWRIDMPRDRLRKVLNRDPRMAEQSIERIVEWQAALQRALERIRGGIERLSSETEKP